jgi:hypothetical protein
VDFLEFESFRAELRALANLAQGIQSRTLRDDALRERFRTLFRIWSSTVEPSIRAHVKSPRELFKLSGELEALARLSSKYKPVSVYRTRIKTAIQLADGLVIYLPTSQPASATRRESAQSELLIPAIPDLPLALVPNALLGWKSRLDAFVREHPFDKSVFIMIRYRKRNKKLMSAVKQALKKKGFFGVIASEHSLTDDLYNPIACLLCCSQGIAIFDKAERREVFNPNVAYMTVYRQCVYRQLLVLRFVVHNFPPSSASIFFRVAFIHFNQRRPAALVAFAGQFLRRVNAASRLRVHG